MSEVDFPTAKIQFKIKIFHEIFAIVNSILVFFFFFFLYYVMLGYELNAHTSIRKIKLFIVFFSFHQTKQNIVAKAFQLELGQWLIGLLDLRISIKKKPKLVL